MALIRRHWIVTIVSLWAVLIGGVGLVVWMNMSQQPARAQEAFVQTAQGAVESAAPVVLDSADSCRVRELRERLLLTDVDLALMGCRKDTASRVFKALGDWFVSQKATWAGAARAQRAAEWNLRMVTDRMWLGTATEAQRSQLSGLRAAAEDAVKQEVAIVESAAPVIATQLSAAQQTVWGRIRVNGGLAEQYRSIPDLTAEQIRALRRAGQSRDSAMMAARTPRDSENVFAALSSAEQQILSSVQVQAMAAGAANRGQCLAEVQQALREVLPERGN